MPTQIQHQKQTSIIISFFLKPIFMLLIFSTFLFIGIAAVSTVLLLLAGSSLRLCPRRRRHHHNRRRSSTLSSEEIQHLLLQFNYDTGVESSRDCAICLEGFEGGELCRRLVSCNHVFHVKCVDSWLTKVVNCPICRSPVCFDSRASASSDDDQNCVNEDYKLWWAV